MRKSGILETMNVLQRLRRYVFRTWEPATGYAAGLVFAGFLLLIQLGRLIPGLSERELQTLQQSRNWHSIVNDPINLPHKILELVLAKLDLIGPFGLRSVSVFFALLTVVAFYYVVCRWHTTRVALLGTALLATSSWFLHFARLATPDILFPAGLLLSLVYGTWIRQTNKSSLAVVTGIALAVTLLYIPGFVWFVALGILWQFHAVSKHLRASKFASIYVALLVGIVLAAPMTYAVYRQPALLKSMAGLPAHIPSPVQFGKNLLHIPSQLFINGPRSNETGIVGLPMLDIFVMAMSFLGAYAYFYRRQLDRTKILVGASIVGSVLVALGGLVSIVLLLPIVYILATAGLAFMLQQWFTVFPRNPLARVIGTSLISVAVIVTAFYHINQYYIAWPNAPETKRIFLLQP